MTAGLLRIQCSQCPAFLVARQCTREEFAEGLEERGWRALTGRQLRIVCPDCAKKLKPTEIAAPKRLAVTS